MGDCGIFSFQETKHITTLGEGGIIITNNEEFAEKCRRIRNHGEYYKDSMEIGYNFRMTEIQAGFGRLQLKRLPQIIKKFKENANYIYKNLPNFIEPPKIKKNVEHSFFILGCKYQQKMLTKTREEYLKKLSEKREKEFEKEEDSDIKGINSKPGKIIGSGYKSVQYEIPLYKKYKPKIKLQNAENFVKQSIFLDIHRWRSRNEINKELELMQNVQKEMSN